MFVTMTNAPLSGQDGTGNKSDLGERGTEIFLKMGLDQQSPKRRTDFPVGLISTAGASEKVG